VVRQFGRSVAAVVARTATQEAMKRIGMSPSSRRTSARSRRDDGFGLADIDRAADKLSSRPLGLLGDDRTGDRGLFGTPQRPSGRR
jgi:hypothetical protein